MMPAAKMGALPDEPMPMGEAGPEAQSEGSEFYLPGSFPGIDKLKEGDSVSLTVLRRDKDGGVAVEPAAGDESETETWDQEARRMAGPTKGY